MEQLFARCSMTREAGQKEYAGGENAFGNFERIASVAGIPREQVLMVYLQKHIDGLWAWSKGHKSQRESVDGRIQDAIVYLVLLQAMAKETPCGPSA
jgi:hypothetical protein